MKRILFVDDEPDNFARLQRFLEGTAYDWELVYVEGGLAGLTLMAQAPFEMVVSDLSMPGMDGCDFVAEVAKKYPNTIRIILSAHTTHAAMLRLVGPAHQYLAKPFDPETMVETMARAFGLQDLLSNEKLKELVAQIQFLPGVPTLALEMLRELRQEDPSVLRLGQLISKDPAVCSKLLQIVNSAFFGLPQSMSSPVEAILHLGVETVKNVVLSLQIYAAFHETKLTNNSLEKLWNHGCKTGALARVIAEAENFQPSDQAFVAGLLHDAGKLVLASGLPRQYTDVLNYARAGRKRLVEAERHFFGATHAEVGAYLLGLWGFAPSVVEAVALHHFPVPSPNRSFNLVTAVHVANVLVCEREEATGYEPRPEMDLEYLMALGLQDRVDSWRDGGGPSALKRAV